jgi:hypothetical protein
VRKLVVGQNHAHNLVQTLVAMQVGDMITAELALEEGLSLARALPYPHGEGRLLEVYARLCLDRGEPAAARMRLAGALATFQRLEARKDVERTERLLATLGRRAAQGAPTDDSRADTR